MYLALESCGKIIKCNHLQEDAKSILLSDPFFSAHLPGLRFHKESGNIKRKDTYTYTKAMKYFTKVDISHLRHFPFFILAKVWHILSKEKKYIIHWGVIIKDWKLTIILWPTWTGKSSIIYKILKERHTWVEVICDDKFVLDIESHSVLYWNRTFSFRDMTVPNDDNFEDSIYSKKRYLKHKVVSDKHDFTHISFCQIRLSPQESRYSIAQNDTIVSLYNNILNTISWNEACALNPTLIASHHIKYKDKQTLLDSLEHITNKELSSSHFIQGSIEFLTDNITNILLNK